MTIYSHICGTCNSNSNWTFIALNLPIQEESKAQQNQKSSRQISVSRDRRGVKHHGEHRGMIQAKVPLHICSVHQFYCHLDLSRNFLVCFMNKMSGNCKINISHPIRSLVMYTSNRKVIRHAT